MESVIATLLDPMFHFITNIWTLFLLTWNDIYILHIKNKDNILL